MRECSNVVSSFWNLGKAGELSSLLNRGDLSTGGNEIFRHDLAVLLVPTVRRASASA